MQRCYKCLQPSLGGLICKTCISPLTSVQSAAEYAGHTKDLLWMLKSSGAQAAAPPMAKIMESYVSKGTLLVPVPTATSRVRQRGYDQSVVLCQALARKTGNPYAKALLRKGHTHQVGASRQQRLSQLSDAYTVIRPKRIRGLRILLIDDVITTGATLESVAAALLTAGATRVDALTFARA